MAPWLIIIGYGLDDWIYWQLLLESLVITINYKNSQSIFSWKVLWGLAPFSFTFYDWLNSDLRRLTPTQSQSQSHSQSYVTTDGQSASLSWNKASVWGLRPEFHYCQTIAGLLIWGALSDERMGWLQLHYADSYILSARTTQRKHTFSIVACVSVGIPTWSLPNRSIGALAAA
jgi:hypothetical protein